MSLTYKVGPNPTRNRNLNTPGKDFPWRVLKSNGLGGKWTVKVFKTKADAQAWLKKNPQG